MNAPKLTVVERRPRISDPRVTDVNRQPPEVRALAKPDVEKALIGAVFLDATQYPRAAQIVQAGDFSDFWHGMIWYAFERVTCARMPVDLISVANVLLAQPACPVDTDAIDFVLASFESYCRSTPASASAWAEIVREAAQRVRLIRACEVVIGSAKDDRLSLAEVTTAACREVARAADVRGRQQTVEEGLRVLIEDIEFVQSGGALPLIPTTIPALDGMIGGFAHGEVAILAGDSGMGKTTLMLSMISSQLARGFPVTLFSIEMDMAEVLAALVAIDTGISRKKLRARAVGLDELELIKASYDRLRSMPLRIDTSTLLRPSDLRMRLLALNLEAEVGVVYVDGLWKMSGDSRTYPDGKRSEVAEISAALTAIAKDEQIGAPPLVVTHQYKDEPRNRGDKRPLMHDLADSSAVRRDAQLVLGLYNDVYYHAGRGRPAGNSELHLLKMRNAAPPRECVVLRYERERYDFGK